MSNHSAEDIASSIISFLRYGNMEHSKSHKGYFSKGGFPYEVLKRHAEQLLGRNLKATDLYETILPEEDHGTIEVQI